MRRVRAIAGHVTALESDGLPLTASATSAGARERGPGSLVVTLIAAGNSGHVCAALFDENTKGRVHLQLLTSRPEVWKNKHPRVKFPDGSYQRGTIHKVSDNPAEVIPNADILLWTGPVTSTQQIFESIRPHMNVEKTRLGVIFAQGFMHIMAHRIFGPRLRFFALRNIPWLCRTVKAGEECEIVGAKASIGIMGVNLDETWVKEELEPLFVTQKIGKWEPVLEIQPDFCPVVFNPANQIIHPARYWGLFRNWNGSPLKQLPSEWLYRDMDETAGQVLEVLDEELQMLKDAYYAATGAEGCKHVISLRERLLDQYGDQIADKSTMAKMVGTNKAYSMAKTPMIKTELGAMPNPHHRVVTDDIGWGLCALVSIAERLEDAGIKTPTTMMRMLIEWHQNLMGKEYLYNGRLRGRDCGELVLLRPSDSLELVANVPTVPRAWLANAEEVTNEHRIGNP
eukprot:TRINITY_DN4011_c2_g1_i1.p1 TRINITY_DN4011_c2_g1~~TRINITY_DN4011_c2_g1_i1.p1  ORF type:complete len:455 (-),score=106.00 TRINITY_DN4011_c2_g1_i1:88-1452(-)